MTTERWAVAALRVFLVLLFGILLVFQFMSVPGQFAHMAEESPGSAHLRWPLTVLFGFWILCVQVVVVATWKLLTLVREDRIFSDAALVWVDAIVAAVGAAWAVLLGVSVLVGLGADDPGPVLVVVLATTGVTVLGLLMVVMRALLRRATELRTDMEAVI